MKAMAVVAWYEIKRNWLVLPGALLMGLLALTAPLVPALHQWNPETVREVAVSVVALAFMGLCAMILGAAILGGGVATGRESFFLARPVEAFSLWLGRLVAALVLSAGAPALVLAPLAVVHPRRVAALLSAPSPLFALLILLPGVIAAAGLVRIMLRARSPWLGVLAVVVTGVYVFQLQALWRPLIRLMLDMDSLLPAGPLLALPLVWSVAFLVGGAMAATRGRTDAKRASSAGGWTVTILLCSLTLVLGGTVRWIFAASPANIVQVATVVPAPEGHWAVVAAHVRRAGVTFPATFLLNTSSGVWQRWPATWWQLAGTAPFSGDGRLVAWWEDRGAKGGAGIRVVKLPRNGGGMPRTVWTRPAPRWASPFGMALSPSGTALATVFGGVLRVWNVEHRHRWTSAPVGDKALVLWLRVSDGGETWLGSVTIKHTEAGRTMTVSARHVARGGRTADPVWRQEDVAYVSHMACPSAGQRADVVACAVREASGSGLLVVRRVDTAGMSWSVPLGDLWPVRQMVPFGRTGVLVISRRPEINGLPQAPSELAFVTRAGIAWRRAAPNGRWLVAGPGPEPGTAVIMINGSVAARLTQPYCERLDLATGTLRPIGTNLVPAALPWFNPRLPAPGSPGSRLFIRDRHLLLRLDADGRLVPVPIR